MPQNSSSVISDILMLGSQHVLGTSWSAHELHHCARDYIINTSVLSAEIMRVLLHLWFWRSKRFHWNWSIVNISSKIDLEYNNLLAIRNLLLFGIRTEKMRRWPLNLYILRILIYCEYFVNLCDSSLVSPRILQSVSTVKEWTVGPLHFTHVISIFSTFTIVLYL